MEPPLYVPLSLPTRERGLKYIMSQNSALLRESLPTRERGLKSFPAGGLRPQHQLSLPTRERGLKYLPDMHRRKFKRVAPYAGAWIEIPDFPRNTEHQGSLPTRERGLK